MKNLTVEQLDAKTLVKYNEVMQVIKNNRLISDRRLELSTKYHIETLPMGKGGVGQIQKRKDGIYVQIGYGKSKYNYADAVLLDNCL